MPSKPQKPKPFDKVKAIKRASRSEQSPHGRGGFHTEQRNRPRARKKVHDYLEELEEEMIKAERCYHCGEGPAGLFEQDEEGLPICDGCREEQVADGYYCLDYMQDDPYGG